MKIEIIIAKDINEQCNGATCFEAPKHIQDAIHHAKPIEGIVLINNEAIKFSFSPHFMDGDIFTNNEQYREIVKYLIPLYVKSTMMPKVVGKIPLNA